MIKDDAGRELAIGDVVMQIIIDPSKGALVQHEYSEGVVVDLGRTRAEVVFPGNYRRRVSGEALHYMRRSSRPMSEIKPGPLDKLAELLEGLASDDGVHVTAKGGRILNLTAAEAREIIYLARKNGSEQ